MGEIKALDAGNGDILYVAIDDIDAVLHGMSPTPGDRDDISDLPRGAEPVSYRDNFMDAAGAIENNIKAVARMVHQSLIDHQPDEWSVELSIGFKGSAGIPVLVSGEASGAIKVSAKWKRRDS